VSRRLERRRALGDTRELDEGVGVITAEQLEVAVRERFAPGEDVGDGARIAEPGA